MASAHRAYHGSLIVLLALAACSPKKADTPAAAPTNSATAANPGVAPMIPEAERVALDSANLHFRAKDYPAALAAYRRAAEAAPNDVAPWFGIHMVATATNNKALVDSALVAMRARGGAPDQSSPSDLEAAHKAAGGISPTAH